MSEIQTLSNKTGVDLSDYYGYAVKFDTDGVNLCSAIDDEAIGIISKGGATESEIVIHGRAVAKAGGTATKGKKGIPHTDGTVKNTASSSQEFCLILQTGIAGDLIDVFVLGSAKAQS